MKPPSASCCTGCSSSHCLNELCLRSQSLSQSSVRQCWLTVFCEAHPSYACKAHHMLARPIIRLQGPSIICLQGPSIMRLQGPTSQCHGAGSPVRPIHHMLARPNIPVRQGWLKALQGNQARFHMVHGRLKPLPRSP